MFWRNSRQPGGAHDGDLITVSGESHAATPSSKSASLRARLVMLSFGVSLCTLFAACIVFFWHAFNDSRQEEIGRVSAAARVVAQSAAAAVAFEDADAANELLTAFRALPALSHAVLYSTDKTLARYSRDPRAPFEDFRVWQPSDDGIQIINHEDHLHVVIPIAHAGQTIGSLVVQADTASLSDLVSSTGYLVLLVFLFGAAASYVLGAFLSTRLVRPIHELARSMEEISNTKNFKKRFAPRSSDEIGQLFKSFNEMLAQIEARDSALEEYRQTLEQRVSDRTAELVRERQQLLGIIKRAPVAMAMLDNNLRYLAHSEKWLEDYALEGQRIVGLCHYDVFPDIPERWKAIHREVLKGHPAHMAEDTFDRADGSKLNLRWAVHPWFNADGTQGGVVMVTDRIDDLVAAREAALQTASMRSEFLTNISHELRTPLNGIIGFAELLSDQADLSETDRSYVDSVLVSSRVLLALINDILDFSKLERGKLVSETTRFRLSDVVQASTQVFAGQAEQKGIKLDIKECAHELLVHGDQLRLQQVLMNLIGNAIKFTASGTITVGVESLTEIGDQIETRFSVQDTGIGIAFDKQAHIFEAFAQADGSTTRKYGGSGLGLAICLELVRLMGGRIWVESTEGVGSIFRFTVRLKRGDNVQEQPALEDTSPVHARTEASGSVHSILVAEDNPMNQKLVSTILTRAGFKVTVVENGLDAVKSFEQGHFALILMDAQMPVMNGLEAIQQIRARERNGQNRVPIVALTAHAFAEHREQCLKVGADEYLTKPLHRQILLETMNRFIAASRKAAEDS